MNDRSWPRPVPLVGDTTSAAVRSADPAGWAFGEAEIAALHAVIAARRDIRRYRADPVAPELLRQVLAAGHQASTTEATGMRRFGAVAVVIIGFVLVSAALITGFATW